MVCTDCSCVCGHQLEAQSHLFIYFFASHLQMGIAIGFLVPPMLVPNVDDMNELAYHIRTMFYICAGVASVLFILVIISKTIARIHELIEWLGEAKCALCSLVL